MAKQEKGRKKKAPELNGPVAGRPEEPLPESGEEAGTEPSPADDPVTADADETVGPSAADEQVELLGFMLADEEYALDILGIKEIVRLQPVTRVPRAPNYLDGIITLRGVIVPVFDLRRRLGLQETEHTADTRIIVVYRGEEYAGLIVDAITQVMRVGRNRVEPPPPTVEGVEAEFITGVTRFDDRLVILLNPERVMDVTDAAPASA